MGNTRDKIVRSCPELLSSSSSSSAGAAFFLYALWVVYELSKRACDYRGDGLVCEKLLRLSSVAVRYKSVGRSVWERCMRERALIVWS